MAEPTTTELYNHFLKSVVPVLHTSASISRYAAGAALHAHPNPLTRCGAKVYSQNEEDGITFEIVRRLGIEGGTFAEFGVDDGTENNTLALVAAGWSGFWVGGEDLAFDSNPDRSLRPNFTYQKQWIKRSNILDLYKRGLASIRKTECDLISLDLDGNDYYFVETLLAANVLPRVFIVEYNAKFLPPIRFTIDYDEAHTWKGDDYFGASLTSFFELFKKFGYFLGCCNITGSNAFFIRNEFLSRFEDVPTDLESLFVPPKYFLTGLDFSGHPRSIRTIEQFFRRLNARA